MSGVHEYGYAAASLRIRGIELASGAFGRGVYPALGSAGKTHDVADAGCDWALGQLCLTCAAEYIVRMELFTYEVQSE